MTLIAKQRMEVLVICATNGRISNRATNGSLICIRATNGRVIEQQMALVDEVSNRDITIY